jgi:uncharacterized protein YyaL (SSP411 family)
MLYDNGQLAELYALAFERTGDPWHGRILRTTLDYVLREMTDASGRFYSAQDAEVDASEGASYVWRPEEFATALTGLDDAEFAATAYGIGRGTNFRDPHDPGAGPVNVLFLTRTPDPEEFARIDRINRALLDVRNRRKQPMTDDKSLAGWNGLMIAGMAEGGRVLEEPRYLDAAVRAADFVLEHMRDASGELLRSYRGGRAAIGAFLEDYAFVIHGLLRLHAATGEARWLERTEELTTGARRLFADPEGRGWFDARPDQADLFVRTRSRYDGATPAASSQMALNLIALHERTHEDGLVEEAASILSSMSPKVHQFPTALTVALRAVDRLVRDFPAAFPGSSAAG